jgi:PDZ domain
MVLLVTAGSVFLALVAFAIGNVAGAAVLKARGLGLISFAHSVPPGRWRAPAARLAGPLAVYLLAGALFIPSFRPPELATPRLSVLPEHAAEAAGLELGDLVVEVDHAPVTNFGQIEAGLKAAGPGRPVEVVVLRGGERVAKQPIVDAEGGLGAGPFGEILVHSWAEGLGKTLADPLEAVESLVKVLFQKLTGQKRPTYRPPRDPDAQIPAAWFAPFLPSVAWFLALLVMIAFQVVAWARGELRAPSPGHG